MRQILFVINFINTKIFSIQNRKHFLINYQIPIIEVELYVWRLDTVMQFPRLIDLFEHGINCVIEPDIKLRTCQY